jgi:hypothetical protein
MKSTIRSALLVTAASLLGLSGCGENNEARVDAGGVTKSGAATSSEDGFKVQSGKKENVYKVGGGAPKSEPGKK